MGLKARGRPGGMEATYHVKFGATEGDPDPTYVILRYPTQRERRQLMSVEGSPESMRYQINVLELCARRHVVSVHNYESAEGRAIATGADLADFGDTEVLDEIFNEVLGAGELSEEEKKA